MSSWGNYSNKLLTQRPGLWFNKVMTLLVESGSSFVVHCYELPTTVAVSLGFLFVFSVGAGRTTYSFCFIPAQYAL